MELQLLLAPCGSLTDSYKRKFLKILITAKAIYSWYINIFDSPWKLQKKFHPKRKGREREVSKKKKKKKKKKGETQRRTAVGLAQSVSGVNHPAQQNTFDTRASDTHSLPLCTHPHRQTGPAKHSPAWTRLNPGELARTQPSCLAWAPMSTVLGRDGCRRAVERKQRVDRGILLGMNGEDLMGERKMVVVVVVRRSWDLWWECLPKTKRERKTKSGMFCYRTVSSDGKKI